MLINWHCVEPIYFYLVLFLFALQHILSNIVLFSTKKLNLKLRDKDKWYYLSVFIPFLAYILLYVNILKVEDVFSVFKKIGLDIEDIL